jgi:hypothetical protein
MASIRRTAAWCAAIGLAAFLGGGCSFTEDALMPSLTGESADAEQTSQDQPSQRDRGQDQVAQQAGQGGPTSIEAAGYGVPSLGTTVFEPEEMPQFQPSGTFVGQKVANLRGDLDDLKARIRQHNGRLQELRRQTRQAARQYHSGVAQMNARLQIGTTPGNPELVEQWNQAQRNLATVDQSVNQMNELANEVSSTSRLAAFLLESVQAAYGLSGAVEQDHEQLAILEDATNRTVVLIDRLANELSEDVSRQNNYLARERSNLSTLSLAIKNGEFYGQSLANRAYGSPQPPTQSGGASQVGRNQPLVVVRFGRDNVQYERALYNAVSRALDRRPQAAFDVVAVAPQQSQDANAALSRSKARRQAERVLRSLNEMGLPPNRVSLSATTSRQADVNQVHVYVR